MDMLSVTSDESVRFTLAKAIVIHKSEFSLEEAFEFIGYENLGADVESALTEHLRKKEEANKNSFEQFGILD